MLKLPGGNYHSFDCAVESAKRKAYKNKTKELKEKSRDSMEWLAESLGRACNWFARESDWNNDCISCYKPIRKFGTNYHAGHCIPYGSKYKYSLLRFIKINIHGQCLNCNGYNGGKPKEYRQGLLNRYGQSYVDALDAIKRHTDSGQLAPLSKDDMRWMTKEYNRLARELKRQRND